MIVEIPRAGTDQRPQGHARCTCGTGQQCTPSAGLPYGETYKGVSENRGTLFWGPFNKDPTI